MNISALKYEDTNDYYWADINKADTALSTNDDTGWGNKDGKVNELAGTRGPFGFGDAIHLKDDKVKS